MKLKKGDTVVVITGKDKGKEGDRPARPARRTTRSSSTASTPPRSTRRPGRANQQAGIIDKDMPIDASNVMLVHKGKPTRVGYRSTTTATKVRVAKPHRRGDRMSDTTTADRRTAPRLKQTLPGRGHGPAARSSSASPTSCRCRSSRRSSSTWASAGPRSSRRCSRARSTTSPRISGQKPIVTKARQLDRRLQAPRGPVDRLQGDAARRPHVGVPRPAGQRRHPPHPRLPRPAGHSWDGRGNYTFGLNEQIVFPEIDYDRIDAGRGMDITIVTTADDQRAGQGAARRLRLPVQAGGRRRRSRRRQAPRPASAARAPAASRCEEEVTGKGIEDGQEGTDQQGDMPSRSTRCGATPAAAAAAGRVRCTASSACAASACASWPTPARSPA